MNSKLSAVWSRLKRLDERKPVRRSDALAIMVKLGYQNLR